MTTMNRLSRAATASMACLACLACVSLSGCFGGGDDSPADPLAAVPDTATATTEGTVAYQQQLTAAADADTREPIDVSAVVLPVSDTTEPVAVP